MSEVPHDTTGDEVDLGALLGLLHGASDSFRTVRATYRTWRHAELSQEAFRADAEEQKRRGASIRVIHAVGSGEQRVGSQRANPAAH
jgi:hypothetical protein